MGIRMEICSIILLLDFVLSEAFAPKSNWIKLSALAKLDDGLNAMNNFAATHFSFSFIQPNKCHLESTFFSNQRRSFHRSLGCKRNKKKDELCPFWTKNHNSEYINQLMNECITDNDDDGNKIGTQVLRATTIHYNYWWRIVITS